MDIIEAINQRHSVRSYKNKEIENDVIEQLNEYIKNINEESGLNIQLVVNEPKAFDSFLAHYGKFSNVINYIALIGKKSKDLDFNLGYYGEKIVLFAQILGLNTCWVGLTYSKIKSAYTINKGEKLVAVISIGYGINSGFNHKSKDIKSVSNVDENSPEWFKKGVELALLAPTAVNQQKFYFTLKDGKVSLKSLKGFYSKMDLGIVKYHFEIGAGVNNINWEE